MKACLLRCLVGCFVATAALIAPVAAEELEHVVRPGESASAIARRYYGGFELTDLLLRFNGVRGSVIRPGETLRIPYCAVHTVRSGETWSGIAQRYLGRPDDYDTIARLNRLDPQAALRIGERVVVPVILDHKLERGETLEQLAVKFYGDPDRADLLRSFNRIDDPRRLSVGREIRIPIASFLQAQLTAPSPAPKSEPTESTQAKLEESAAPAAKQQAEKPEQSESERRRDELAGKLRDARRAFDEGQFAGALEQLQSLAPRIERERDQVLHDEFRTLLASVYIAFDRPEEACRVFLTAAGAAPRAELDPDQVSPKIRNALARCGPDAAAGNGG
jgi:LysM repeat protein